MRLDTRDVRAGCRMFGDLARDLRLISRIQKLYLRLHPKAKTAQWQASAAYRYLTHKQEIGGV